MLVSNTVLFTLTKESEKEYGETSKKANLISAYKIYINEIKIL